ncbi:glycosyltransferase family 4 protein [Halalkalicoccus ordinarius]|uniref:glycosyltransferase family 4 protein n=1 Tax=Halalkalicoccus ordinarius TaxID=3116651 RepID=UPI00300F5F0E
MPSDSLAHISFISDRLQHYLDQSDTTAGGAQRQQYLLAQELLKRGQQVSAIVGDHGQPAEVVQKGVRTVRGCPKDVSNPGDLPGAFSQLERAIRRVDADVYYVRGAPRLYIATRLLTWLHRKPLIFGIANDSDLNPEYLESRYGHTARVYRRLLPRADEIITQTQRQHDVLLDEFNRSSTVISNAYTLPPEEDVLNQTQREHVLWVGSSDPDQKKPKRYLRLAREIPDAKFVMISQDIGHSGFHRELMSEAEAVPNLTFIENVPPEEVHDYYRKATVFVNTSDYEGFPNTFLEAWRYETPVVSLYYTLDDILKQKDVGLHSGSMEKLIDDVSELHEDEAFRQRLGKNGRELVKREYSIKQAADKYQCVISRL